MVFDRTSIEIVAGEHVRVARQIFDELKIGNFLQVQELLDLLNDLHFHLSDAASLVILMSAVHPDGGTREMAEKLEMELMKFSIELSLSQEIFQQFKNIDTSLLDGESKRMVEKTVRDFQRSGVDKDEKTRNIIQKLSEELVEIGQIFSKNIREDLRSVEVPPEALLGLPQDYIETHSVQDNGLVKITTEYPDINPFLLYAHNPEVRKQLYIQFLNRAVPQNREVLQKMLQKRYEMAQLLGYATWADYSAEDKMTRESKTIEKFISELDTLTREAAEGEYHELLETKRKTHPEATCVEAWEKPYLSETLRKEKFAFDSHLLRTYFEYHAVKQGLFDISSKLYGLRYKKLEDGDVWHEDVEVYEVLEGDNLLGKIYLDMHPRENKFNHAAQFSLKTGIAHRQIPEGVLVCNFTDPKKAKNGVALLSHSEVTTFFHEFGHLLHYIFAGSHRYVTQSGLTMEWDFVEAPSQFFEEWVKDAGVLSTFAKHFETKEVIPSALVEKMKQSELFGNALFVRQQVSYAALSLAYYSQNPKDFDTHEVMKSIYLQYSLFPFVEGTSFELSFGHLDDYSALYYTYLWSLVISKDLLTPFKEHGLMDTDVAMKYRHMILEKGGTRDAGGMIQDFLGREYSFEAFHQWLEGK